MAQMGSAHKVDSAITWPRFPGLLQEVFQRRPKPKSKKQKSQIDDTRTEISYSASTFAGEADFETSTYVSKDLGTPSSRSVESKRSKKRGKQGSKKSFKDMSGSLYSEAPSSAPGTPEQSKEHIASPSYLVTLNCPLCYDPDCILNKAAQCPLLRHNDSESINNDCCTFCGTTCQCGDNKKKFLPVSGLVPRDENGIALTLLKENGGPIENSYEWANRQRWIVPSYIKWEHKISEWITAPMQENMKAETGHRKKSHKFKNKRKGKPTPSTFTAAPEITSNGEDARTEEEDQETKLIVDGHGFKIFAKGKEKILINYDKKNCKYMGCSCVPGAEATNCGCGDGFARGEKSTTKHNKNCLSRSKKISLLKETSHGMVPVQKELEPKYAREKSKSSDVVVEKSASTEKYDESKQKLKKEDSDKKAASSQKPKDGVEGKMELIGKDVRNQSRADVLETSLKILLGDDYKNGGDYKPALPENQPDILSVPCPALDQPGANLLVGNLGVCTCDPYCCYATETYQ